MPAAPEQRTAVITGIGVIAPGGNTVEQFWELVTAGRSVTRPITLFDASAFRSRIAAECDFDPGAAGLSVHQARRWDRTTQFAVVAARQALADADGDFDPDRTGVCVGTASGLTASLEREYAVTSDEGRVWEVPAAQASPYLYDYFVPSSMAVEIAWLAGAEGPVSLLSTACASGVDVVANAADLIRSGAADVMIAGASDAAITPLSMAGLDAIMATSPRNDEPETASRPFDRTRNGFVLGEGAGFVVLEEAGHARRRGADVYATVAGHGTRCNAYSMTGLRPDGREMAAAIGDALARARVNRDEIDHINAHGSSTRQNDLHETVAYKEALGEHAYSTPISSLKSMIGHSLGSMSAIEVVACALALKHGVIPPTANLREPDPECDLDYVPLVARERALDVVLSVASGFGGFQSAIVLTRPERRTP